MPKNTMPKNTIEIKDQTIFDHAVIKLFFKFAYLIWFKLSGWKATEQQPRGAGITIAAPHTSNWDIFYALGAAILSDVKIYFSIKASWCTMPVVGRFILWLGGIPISREAGAQGQVALIKNFVDRHKTERIFFLFTPEGTRGGVQRWRTGFYHVAKDTGLPIFLAKVDYRVKEAGVFHTFLPTDNKDRDIANIQESYKSVRGKFPKKQFPTYIGPYPQLSLPEQSVMSALYALKGLATEAEIRAKAKLEELSIEMLDFLVEQRILERINLTECGQTVTRYRITTIGSGYLFHLVPAGQFTHKTW